MFLIGTALYDGQDRPETQCTTEESARFMSDPVRAMKFLLKRLRKCSSEATVLSWSFPCQESARSRVLKGAYWEGEAGITVAGDVFFDTADCGAVYHGE